MRDISCLAGVNELNNIKKYTLEELTPDERQFIKEINEIVEDYRKERSDSFFRFHDLIELQTIWRKYEHLRPFQFLFDPEEKMPKVFHNRIAFIIWTVWRAKHLICQGEDVKSASLAAAAAILKYKLSISGDILKCKLFFSPIPDEVKKEAVREFQRVKGGFEDENELDFWESKIFPYLEGEWVFAWKLEKTKQG